MPEQPDVTPVVEEPNVEAPVVQEQGVTDPAAEGQGVDTQVADEQRVPLDRFQKVIEEKNAAEARAALAEQTLAIQAANPPQQQQAQQQAPQSNFEKAVIDCGLQDIEYLTVQQQAQVNARSSQYDAAAQSQNVQQIMNQNFVAGTPDYAQVVGANNHLGQFVPSAEITELARRKPHLANAMMASSEAAYKIVMDERALARASATAQTAAQAANAQKVDAATAPMSPAAAGGPGVITKPGHFTRSEQEDMERRVAAGEFDT